MRPPSSCWPPPRAAAARAADPIFDQSRLHEVRIVIDPKDWQALRENFRSNQYYAANISLDGEVVEQVGIRSRGDGSRNEEKPGLKIDFNKYIKTQEFHGYKTMVLDNLWQDPSLHARAARLRGVRGDGHPGAADRARARSP